MIRKGIYKETKIIKNTMLQRSLYTLKGFHIFPSVYSTFRFPRGKVVYIFT